MIVGLLGGLANQMWQAAFGISVAEARREELFFTRFRVDGDVKRSYGLDAFQIEPKFVDKETKSVFHDGGRFNPNVYTAPFNTTFIGYWQTERYLNPALVKQAFCFRGLPSDKSISMAGKISRVWERSVSIHVRRSDYAAETHTRNYHGLLPMKYYNNAMSYIRERVENPQFFVFSDDPDWCRQNFSDATIVDHNKPGNGKSIGQEHEDLWLMSCTRHAIMANSAFSWWSCWLAGDKEGKIAIAPKQWFQNPLAQQMSQDLIPERWLRL